MYENPISFGVDLTYVSLFLILLVVPLFILFAVVVIRYLIKGNIIPILVFGLATGIALFVVVMYFTLQVPSVTVHQQARVQVSSPFLQSKLILTNPVDASSPGIVNSLSEQPVVARKPNDSGTDIGGGGLVKPKLAIPDPLPDWVVTGLENTKQNQSNLLESSRPVFQSGLFATREEAMQDALSKAMQQLQANLLLRYPQYKSNLWRLNPELIRQSAYRKVHYQTVEHDFGNVLKSGEPFKQDMYRAYLEVEDSPVIRQALLTKWKRNIGNERTVWLGGGLGLITLLCAGIAVYLRATHDPATIRQT
ncbi:hypothetical protein [uncultured Gimesia sp.]|uniref:hypothetical protein n=1 Tax=uncultured Gimesia sp. TaxID=1678688 RepID=UPI00262A1FC9|nr:hypothetical protein [uncultured Gimesia sp.]